MESVFSNTIIIMHCGLLGLINRGNVELVTEDYFQTILRVNIFTIFSRNSKVCMHTTLNFQTKNFYLGFKAINLYKSRILILQLNPPDLVEVSM